MNKQFEIEYKVTMADGHVYKVRAHTPEEAAILSSSQAIQLQRKYNIKHMECPSHEEGNILYEGVGIFVVYNNK